MELALGTAQFGSRYGIAGRAMPAPEVEVRLILARAAALGIRTLDTAAAYGDIEARLTGLMSNGTFKVVTKLPAIPSGLTPDEAAGWLDSALQRARERLGGSLYALMFHRAEDLLSDAAQILWERCAAWACIMGCKLGVSCYDPQTLNRVRERFPITIAQLPFNALDQRLNSEPIAQAHELEIHIRSVFLQGLLLMPEAEAVRRVPQAAIPLVRWHAWLREQGLDALSAALGLAKSLPGASCCVVGVDTLSQLEAIATAWQTAPALCTDELSVLDLDVIDPRRWRMS